MTGEDGTLSASLASASPPVPPVGALDALLVRLRRAVGELDCAVRPGEQAALLREVERLFERAMTALYATQDLPAEDTVRQVLAACGASAAALTPLHWGRRHFVHQLLTAEFVGALADHLAAVADGPIVEVGAGRGILARALRASGIPVIATDDGSWLDGRLAWPNGLPASVAALSYEAALSRYAPACVICSWMPLGEDWTPAFRACPSVHHYVLIGEGPGGCTGTAASFTAPPPWRRSSLHAVARHGLTRNADRDYQTMVYRFSRR